MSELQSLDSLALAVRIEQWYEANRPDSRLPVLIEVNTSGEATKQGVNPHEVMAFAAALGAYPHLDPQGLMTVAHLDPIQARIGFQVMADLRRQLRDRDGQGWNE
jgi:uncharacterized pyridoxal phosphate-containing UPF0001 family protein